MKELKCDRPVMKELECDRHVKLPNNAAQTLHILNLSMDSLNKHS